MTEEVHVRRLFTRTAAVTLCVTLGFGLAAAPCLAADAKSQVTLTKLSPASRQILAKTATRGQQNQPASAPSTPTSFFKSTKGKVTLALMGAGVGFTFWSINHDRKPVKSPVR
jgi:hypothetical protein